MLGTLWNAMEMCDPLLIWEEEIFMTWVALLTLSISRVCHHFAALIKRHGPERRGWGWMTLRWKPSSWPSPRNWPSYRVLLAPVRSWELLFGRMVLYVCKWKACFHLWIRVFNLLRKNLRGAQDRSGSVEQSRSLEGGQRTYVGCVLHQSCPGSVPGR